MTKNDKCLNSLIKKARKLRGGYDNITYEYEKNGYVKPVPVLYGIMNAIDSLLHSLIIALDEKKEEKNDTAKEDRSSEKAFDE